jgi:hypothetical protein
LCLVLCAWCLVLGFSLHCIPKPELPSTKSKAQSSENQQSQITNQNP